jgi:hypothetical protein
MLRRKRPSALARFVADLATDSEKHRAYIEDPEKAMRAAKLSSKAKAILRSGDWQKIYSAFGWGGRTYPIVQQSHTVLKA